MRDVFRGADIHLSQGDGALGLLNAAERTDASRLVEMCRTVWNEGQVDPTMTREAGRLVEVLARRSARAMPFAALGRALLADLHGSPRDRDALLIEFQNKLAMLGL